MAGRHVHLDTAELVAAFRLYGARGRDLSEPMATIAEMMVTAVHDKFDQGGPGWEDLAESTKRNRRGSEYQILVDTGILMGSIATRSGKTFSEVSTSVEYAVYHVSAEPRSKIPLRDFFDLPAEVYEDAVEIIIDYLANG